VLVYTYYIGFYTVVSVTVLLCLRQALSADFLGCLYSMLIAVDLEVVMMLAAQVFYILFFVEVGKLIVLVKCIV
jgi:hypothetical protein